MAARKRSIRKHAVRGVMKVHEFSKAGTSLNLEISADGEKIGELEIGRGGLMTSPLITKRVPELVVAVYFVASGCTHPSGPRAQPVSSVLDTSAFAMVVDAIGAQSRQAYQIDIAPLHGDSDVVEVTAATKAPLTEQERERRSAVVRALGMSLGDATVPAFCATIMVPYSPSDLHRGCPNAQRQVAAIAIPRSVSPTARDPADTSRRTQWVSRVIVNSIGPHGASSELWDYYLERANQRWRLVGSKVVGVVE